LQYRKKQAEDYSNFNFDIHY